MSGDGARQEAAENAYPDDAFPQDETLHYRAAFVQGWDARAAQPVVAQPVVETDEREARTNCGVEWDWPHQAEHLHFGADRDHYCALDAGHPGATHRCTCRSEFRKKCPDDATCHHACKGPCWRVGTCGPLSGTYPGDDWPEEIKDAHRRSQPAPNGEPR